MRKFSVFSLICLAIAIPAGLVAQDPATAPKTTKPSPFASILGEVTAIDPAAKKVTIKADAGTVSEVPFDDKTHFLKLAPGEKDMKKAGEIQFAELAVGDRALARVRKLDDGSTSTATTVVIMTKAELAKHQMANQAEWQQRGITGTVTVANAATKEVTLKTLGAESKQIVIEPSDKVNVRRYAPDSVKFADAKTSNILEIKAGDTIRVLGAKNEDGTRVVPEEIVYGTFTRQAGTILAVDAAAGTVRMMDITSKKPVNIKINESTTVKKLPAMVAAMMARSQQGGGAPGGSPDAAGGPPSGAGPGGAGPSGGAPGGAARPARSGPPTDGASGAPGRGPGMGGPGMGGPGMGGPGGPGGGKFDPSRVLDRAPSITLADLKVGDAIMVSSSSGPDATTVTAISLVAGIEPLLTAPTKGGRPSALDGGWNLEMSIPQ